jgi:hypothetical protein
MLLFYHFYHYLVIDFNLKSVERSSNRDFRGPEGFVANGLKVVDREEFSKANRAKGALLKAKQ